VLVAVSQRDGLFFGRNLEAARSSSGQVRESETLSPARETRALPSHCTLR
jgi:hypothetical protein